MTRADAVASFVGDTDCGNLPPAVVARAKTALIDTVGCALAGGGVRASRAVLALVEAEAGAGQATVWTTGRRASISQAVLANAVLASALDFDDGHYWSMSHPGAAVVPAALAAAEARKRSGRDVLAGVVVGYEIAIHAGAILNARPRERIYGSGAPDAYGAAAAVARLLGLDRRGIMDALGIARCHLPVSPVLDSIPHGAMTKESLGWGAVTGTTAALLAEAGFTGPPTRLEEPHQAGGGEADLLAELGRRWRITETYVKRFPACLWTHAAVEAALTLRREERLASEQIQELMVWTHQRAVTIDDPAPRSVEAAQYSLPYTVAAALADGELGVEQMQERRLGEARILELAARVRLALDPRLDAMYPARRAARVEIRTTDGRKCEREVLTIKGSAEDPLTAPEVDDKFLRLAAPVLGESGARRALGVLREVERHDDLAPLWAALGRGSDPVTRQESRE
ncbi:MAG TPA: MmgE/PrpD family protein [Methylomirabilota bacterium]|jgi:2-methylcitrate dehydratase PrpD|nr:MmgE/PrpD family protein [Methylomirabilota bacterium]